MAHRLARYSKEELQKLLDFDYDRREYEIIRSNGKGRPATFKCTKGHVFEKSPRVMLEDFGEHCVQCIREGNGRKDAIGFKSPREQRLFQEMSERDGLTREGIEALNERNAKNRVA